MNVIELNDETFLMYAIKNYDNPNCSGLTEFNDDVQRFKYLKRLFFLIFYWIFLMIIFFYAFSLFFIMFLG